jgi:hypothetical protein
VIYEHNNGTRSRVKLYQAGLGVRKIRIANLSPELSEEKIKYFLSGCGLVMDVKTTYGQIHKVYKGV